MKTKFEKENEKNQKLQWMLPKIKIKQNHQKKRKKGQGPEVYQKRKMTKSLLLKTRRKNSTTLSFFKFSFIKNCLKI